MAIRILMIPSSSAASERNWLAFSYIHDKKRNQLTNEQVMKLVYIYSNYKLICPKQESSDIMKAVTRFNNRLISEDTNLRNYNFLDPDSNDILNEDTKELRENEYEILTDIESEDRESSEEDSDDE
jgi:hypothetical protein